MLHGVPELLGAFILEVGPPPIPILGIIGELRLALIGPMAWLTTFVAVAFLPAFLLKVLLCRGLLNSIQIHGDNSISPVVAESVVILGSPHHIRISGV